MYYIIIRYAIDRIDRMYCVMSESCELLIM